jgi:hypothetical protein
MNVSTLRRNRHPSTVTDPSEQVWQPVVQSMLTSSLHSAENRASARACVLDWAGNARRWRGGWRESIPESAYEGVPFEALEEDFHLQVTTSGDGRLWCFHVEHPDASPRPRRWKLEAFVADKGQHDEMGVRVFCQAARRDFVPSNTPALVKSFVANQALVDAGVPLTDTAMVADTDDRYDQFAELLHSEERKLPIVAVSERVSRTEDPHYAVKPDLLARALQGIAHVVALPQDQTLWLNDEVGRDISVFNGAIRVYRPGFHAHANKGEHPLYLAERVVMDTTQNSFDRQLARRLRLYSVDSKAKLDAWPRAEQETPATGRSQSLFEGLRRALGLFRR